MNAKRRKQVQKMIIELLPKKNYHIGKVLEVVGISRMTLHKWRRDNEEFNREWEDAFELDIDDAEEKMSLLRRGIPKIENGKFVGWIERPHFKALAMFLQSKAKHRGWGNSIEVNNVSNVSALTDEELEQELYKLGYEPRKKQ